jgi:hypothetical protein
MDYGFPSESKIKIKLIHINKDDDRCIAEMSYSLRKFVICISILATAGVEIEEAGNLFVPLKEQNCKKSITVMIVKISKQARVQY